MNEPSRSDEELEQLVERALRRLPLRTAPPTLECRVHRELHRLAAQPWWRHSFVHWPAAARAGFVLVCITLAGGMFLEGTRVTASFTALPEWLYAGLALGGVLYVLLFALGAAAYRALYLNPPFKVT